ncbi:MAG: RNA polymerase factor sigma-54 [Planctomycetes bacterium]|nr:RNA polymerase factor sigma-54 [Planctomycetota bacterium]
MKLELTQKLQQSQILAPQMILSMDVLLLNVAELQNRIEKEFTENPALEIAENIGEEAESKDAAKPPEPAPAESELFRQIEAFQRSHPDGSEDWRPRRPRSDDGGDRLEMLQNTEGKPLGLKEHLTQQLHLQDLGRELQEIGEQIINNLDHRGYLLCPASEVFDSLGGGLKREDFDRALAAVRSLDPAGVGAEDLRQCLLLQLERDKQEYPLETQIILKHLEDLGENRIPKIAKELGATLDEIKDAIEIVASLDPIPGARYESPPTIYVRPDVFVEKVEGKLEVRVEDGSLPQLNISESCRRLLKESRGNPEVAGFIRKKIESAQWLIQAVRQRQRTLYDIAVAMVDYQRELMERGPEHLRAMRMQTIADLVHVHISTVSRAIKGKYMQTPWGLFEMRYFFTGGVESAGGEVESRRNVYRKIAEIIEAEDKRHPLSDSDIMRILRERGLNIARRTVTKYREQEKIPSSRLRRSY